MLERIKSAFKRKDPYNEVLRNAEARLSAYESKLLKIDVKAWEQQAARDRRSLESVHLECWKRIMTLHSWAANDLLEIAYTQSVLVSKRGWLRLCLCAAAIQVLHQRAKASEGWRRVFHGIAEERDVEYRTSGKFPVLPAHREGSNTHVSAGSTADLEARLPLDIDRFCATAEELVRDFSVAKRLQKKISRITDRLIEIDADFTAQQPTLRELPKDVRKATLSDLIVLEVKLSTEEEELIKEMNEVLESLGSLPDARSIHPASPWFFHLLAGGETKRLIEAFPPTASLLASDVRRGVANAQETIPTPISPQLLLTISTIIYHGFFLKQADFLPESSNNLLTERSRCGTYYAPVSAALVEVHSALHLKNSIVIPSASSISLFCRLHELIERQSALIEGRSNVSKRFERLIADQRSKDGRLLQRGLQRMFVDNDFEGGMYAFDLPRFLTFGPGAVFAAETRAAMGIVSPETVASARFVNSHSPRIVLADGIDGGSSSGSGNEGHASGGQSEKGVSIEMGLMGNSSPIKKTTTPHTSIVPLEDTKEAYNNSRNTIVMRRSNPEVAAIRYGRTSSSSLSSSSSAESASLNSKRSISQINTISLSSSSSVSSPSISKSPSLTSNQSSSKHKGAMPTPGVVRMFLAHLVKEVATNNNLFGINSSSSSSSSSSTTTTTTSSSSVDAPHTLEQQRKALRTLVDSLVFARLHAFIHAGIDVAPLQPWSAAESPSFSKPTNVSQISQPAESAAAAAVPTRDAAVKKSVTIDSEVAIPVASTSADLVRSGGNGNSILTYIGGPQRPVGCAADVMLRRDKIWQRKKVSVSRMTAAEIGLPSHFITPLPSDLYLNSNAVVSNSPPSPPPIPPFEVSAALLSRLDNLYIPSQICKVIVAAVDAAIMEAKARLLSSTLSSTLQGTISTSTTTSTSTTATTNSPMAQGDVTAEDLIPLLIYITSRSSWQRPHATLSFVSAYGVGPGFGASSSSSSSSLTLGGRESYLFTVLQSCVSWVCQRSSEETNGSILNTNGGSSVSVSVSGASRSSIVEDTEFTKQLFTGTRDENSRENEEEQEAEEEAKEIEDDDDDGGEYISLMLVDEFERDIEDDLGMKQNFKESLKNQGHLEGALEMFA